MVAHIMGSQLERFDMIGVSYHSNTVAESRRECVQDVYSRIQPLCPPSVGTSIKRLYLGSKHGDYGTGRTARLELGGQRMWEVMSLFVCILYSFKAAVKIVSKLVGNTEVDETWDIALVETLLEDNSCNMGASIDAGKERCRVFPSRFTPALNWRARTNT